MATVLWDIICSSELLQFNGQFCAADFYTMDLERMESISRGKFKVNISIPFDLLVALALIAKCIHVDLQASRRFLKMLILIVEK